ncbi:hypothetical protein PL8927_840008 [Planktothrix serta PCC 8927]|uniref:Uncharacterized protein n=1 Tax=Planktothrix serta PCC 8927 TaxID=671068 RepID=A0A7Z9C3W2_9CYAN|nr:hypothetical protein PL8927_840008 [Planktothrix serta PCC 8927]
MKHLYTLLLALSVILINPWGDNRGEIWTYPKIFAVLLITLLNLSILWTERFDLTILISSVILLNLRVKI